MNAVQMLAKHAWVERLGLTLLHFLWQGALVAAIYAITRKWTTRTNGRYCLACAALAAMVLAPVITWMLLGEPSPESVAVTFNAPLSAARTEAIGPISQSLLMDADRAVRRPFFSWVVALWLIGVIAFSVRLLGGWILIQRLRSTMMRPASAEWQRTLDRLKTRIRISRTVRVLVSGFVQAPATLGWLRPIVLLPAGVLTGLSAAQLEAFLLHELAHIRRHDYLIHLLQCAVEAFFFYHPAVWWISGHMRAERELCCDDIAVSIMGDAVVYARALAELDSARLIQRAPMAANGGSLAERIARLLGQSFTSRRTSCGPATALVPILLAIGALAVFAQPAARPQFEVASIKPSLGDRVMNVRALPGRLTADATLQILVQYAYGVPPFQVSGGPGWVQSERYLIDAKADGKANRDQMFVMLQSLLENRFQLKTHYLAKDLPVYTLVAAKGGLKLPSRKEGGCIESAADASAEWVGRGRIAPPGEVPLTPERCGSAGITLGPNGARMRGTKVAMPELVRILTMLLGRKVIDQTGFTGVFGLQLDFVPDDTTPAMPAPPSESGISGASIGAALRQQLGIQLESMKGPVQVIVVDHAERPSPN